jgi:ABC-type uncharacterized transport system substrate-binding protein
VKKILNGLIALIVVAGILLISDWGNRKGSTRGNNKMYKMCFVHYSETAISEEAERGVHDELKRQGLIEGKDFTLKVLSAQGDMPTLNSIAEFVANETWDLVFIASTPTLQVFSKKVTNLPIVFTNTGDPVGAGVCQTFDNHIPNMTGICTSSDFDGMVDLITKVLPEIKTIGTIYTQGEINSVKFVKELEKAGKAKGINVIAIPANTVTEVSDAAISLSNQPIGAVVQIADNLTASCSDVIVKQVNGKNIPYFGFISSQIEKGAVATHARDFHQAGADAVQLGLKILHGKSPADIPIQYVSRTETRFNAEMMKKFNLTIPKEYANQNKLFNPSKKFAIVHYVLSPDCEDVTKGILARFGALGHKKGSDFKFDEYNANGDIATLNNIVRVVVEKKYDLIFSTVLAPTQALASKISDVPILFTVVADPVGNGLGNSYSDHKPNLAGIDGMSYTDKGIELLLKYMPVAKTIGTLYCPGEMASISSVKELEKSCLKYNLKLVTVPVNSVSEVTDATASLCMKKIDAISQLPDNITIPGFASIVKVTRKQQLPLFCYISSQVQEGAIAAVAGDYVQQGSEIADIAIRIINGESPASIPFSRIKQIKTVVNIGAAKAYGLETPSAVLEKADEVIQ